MFHVIALTAAILLMAVPAASASCVDEIMLFAQQYGLDASKEPLAGAPDRPATTESRGADPGDTRLPENAGAGVAGATVAKRARMQTLLDAARNAEANGSEAQCLERLGEARAIPESG